MTGLKEACGVFGVYDLKHGPVFSYIYWGLIAQNHRGHQSHGLLTYDGDFHDHKGLGLVPRMRSTSMSRWLTRLPGHVGIGNIRYTTSGRVDVNSLYKDTQPVIAEAGKVKIAISYNGNIVNVEELRGEIANNLDLEATSDAELLSKKLCLSLDENGDLSKAVERCMRDVEGAYSVVGVTEGGELFAFRDCLGIKPLCVGFDLSLIHISEPTRPY